MMLYKIVSAKVLDNGSIQTAKHSILFQHPTVLNVGGLYVLGNLRRKRLYKILERVL